MSSADATSDAPPLPASSSARVPGRFLGLLLVGNLAMFGLFQGIQQILLPSQVADIDPAGKVAAYGVLASLGAGVAAVGNPLFGALSDRTRGRFGRRAPWLLAGAIVAFLALLLLGGMRSLFTLGVVYVAVMAAMSAYQAVIGALVPDRVPEARRGLVSSLIGVATTVGVLLGVNGASALAGNRIAGYAVLGAVLVVATILLVTLSRDPVPGAAAPAADTEHVPLPVRLGRFFSSLADRDFRWAFVARVLMMAGYWTINTYLLYTLTDYIGTEAIPGGNASTAVATLATVSMVTMFVTTLFSGALSDRLNRRKAFVIVSSMGMAAAAVIPLVSPTWTGMLLYSALSGLFFGIYGAVDQAIMTLVLPKAENTGRDLGLLNVATTGPQIAGPFIAAAIIGLTGGYGGLFAFVIVTALLGAVAIVPIRKIR